MSRVQKKEPGQQEQRRKIDHLDFHMADFRKWQQGRTHEEVGTIVSAIAFASEQDDEAYIEQFPFIDRIVYTDGTWRKIIRGTGEIETVE
jgi:hypothetical protein